MQASFSQHAESKQNGDDADDQLHHQEQHQRRQQAVNQELNSAHQQTQQRTDQESALFSNSRNMSQHRSYIVINSYPNHK